MLSYVSGETLRNAVTLTLAALNEGAAGLPGGASPSPRGGRARRAFARPRSIVLSLNALCGAESGGHRGRDFQFFFIGCVVHIKSSESLWKLRT